MIKCFDTATRNFQGGVPDNAQAIIFYNDAHFANEVGARRRFPRLFATGRAIGMTALQREPSQGDDFEPGNARHPAGPWVATAIKLGVFRPVVYMDEADWENLVKPSLEATFGRPLAPPGLTRRFRTIIAHPDGNPTIPPEHDGKQYWFGSIQGHHRFDMDISVLRDDFFDRPGVSSKPQPHPQPHPQLPEGTVQLQTYKTAINSIGLAVLTDQGEVLHIEQQHPTGDNAPGHSSDFWRDDKGNPRWLSLGRPGQK